MYNDPFPPDCKKCGGYIPGNPNAYLGQWCRCSADKKPVDKQKPKKKENQEFIEFIKRLSKYQ